MDDRRGSTRDVDRERPADHADRAGADRGDRTDASREDRDGGRADGWDRDGERTPLGERDERPDREERGGERPDSEGPDGAASDRGDGDADGSSVEGVLGARPDDVPRPNLGPESPSPENAAFVVLGVLFALFVIYRTIAVLPT